MYQANASLINNINLQSLTVGHPRVRNPSKVLQCNSRHNYSNAKAIQNYGIAEDNENTIMYQANASLIHNINLQSLTVGHPVKTQECTP
jgi:hypothetical protein